MAPSPPLPWRGVVAQGCMGPYTIITSISCVAHNIHIFIYIVYTLCVSGDVRIRRRVAKRQRVTNAWRRREGGRKNKKTFAKEGWKYKRKEKQI